MTGKADQSLFGTERERYVEFRTRHLLTCNTEPKITYTGCGIGTAIDVDCPKCGATENITDYGSW